MPANRGLTIPSGPLSPDIEDRRQGLPPSLMQKLSSAMSGLLYKAQLAGPEFMNATFGTPASLNSFYVPGQDASSMPALNAQQAAQILSRVNQRFPVNGR